MFKTASFKIHNPSRRKKQIMDTALQTVTTLTANAYTELASKIAAKKTDRLRQVRCWMPSTKELDVHSAVREGCIQSIEATLSSYVALREVGGNAPVILSSPEAMGSHYNACLQELPMALTDEDAHNLSQEMKRASKFKFQPVLFGGYANTAGGWSHRYYAILKNAKGQYFALLYLASVKHCKSVITDMIDVRTGEVIQNLTASGAILCPLSFGESYQKERYIDAPCDIKTAELIKRGEDYFLNVVFDFPEGGDLAENFIGVDVGMITPVAITVVDGKGKVLYTKSYNSDVYKLQARYRREVAALQARGKQVYLKHYKTNSLEAMFHEIVNEMIEIAKKYNAVFVVEDLDGKFITRGKFVTSCYRKITHYLEYKSRVAKGHYVQFPIKDKKTGLQKTDKNGQLMWAKFTVLRRWPGGTSKFCHICGEYGERGKGDERNHFWCQTCGYDGDADINAAVNIARRGLYKKGDWGSTQEFHRSFNSKEALQLLLF